MESARGDAMRFSCSGGLGGWFLGYAEIQAQNSQTELQRCEHQCHPSSCSLGSQSYVAIFSTEWVSH